MTERAGIEYKRLPGSGPRRMRLFSVGLSKCRLYLGADHVLAVENMRFSEDYKRFYYRDIQALVLRRDRRLLTSAAIQAGLLLAFLFFGLAASPGPFRVFWWCVAFVCFISLIINSLRGPTCVCRVMTAVQEEVLPSLNRVRVARKVIDGTLRPLIEKVQGSIQPGDLSTAFAGGVATRWKDEPPTARTRTGEPEGQPEYRAGAHMLAFFLFIANAILMAIDILHHSSVTSAVSNLVALSALVCLIVGLVKQRGSILARSVRRIAWATLVFVCLYYVLVSMNGIAVAMNAQRAAMNQVEVYRAMFSILPQGSSFLLAVSVFDAVGALVLGISGLLLTLRKRPPRTTATGPARIHETAYKA